MIVSRDGLVYVEGEAGSQNITRKSVHADALEAGRADRDRTLPARGDRGAPGLRRGDRSGARAAAGDRPGPAQPHREAHARFRGLVEARHGLGARRGPAAGGPAHPGRAGARPAVEGGLAARVDRRPDLESGPADARAPADRAALRELPRGRLPARDATAPASSAIEASVSTSSPRCSRRQLFAGKRCTALPPRSQGREAHVHATTTSSASTATAISARATRIPSPATRRTSPGTIRRSAFPSPKATRWFAYARARRRSRRRPISRSRTRSTSIPAGVKSPDKGRVRLECANCHQPDASRRDVRADLHGEGLPGMPPLEIEPAVTTARGAPRQARGRGGDDRRVLRESLALHGVPDSFQKAFGVPGEGLLRRVGEPTPAERESALRLAIAQGARGRGRPRRGARVQDVPRGRARSAARGALDAVWTVAPAAHVATAGCPRARVRPRAPTRSRSAPIATTSRARSDRATWRCPPSRRAASATAARSRRPDKVTSSCMLCHGFHDARHPWDPQFKPRVRARARRRGGWACAVGSLASPGDRRTAGRCSRVAGAAVSGGSASRRAGMHRRLPRGAGLPGSKRRAAHHCRRRSARRRRATSTPQIAVVDRVGNVLAVFQMDGAPATVAISSGLGVQRRPRRNARRGSIPATLAAITKAITGAYLSSDGNAFSTRTASQIVAGALQSRRGAPALGAALRRAVLAAARART